MEGGRVTSGNKVIYVICERTLMGKEFRPVVSRGPVNRGSTVYIYQALYHLRPSNNETKYIIRSTKNILRLLGNNGDVIGTGSGIVPDILRNNEDLIGTGSGIIPDNFRNDGDMIALVL